MTNKEIAEILNITPAAVSMALHNKGGVSSAKKKQILQLKYKSDDVKVKTEKKGTLLFAIHKRNGNVISETHFFITIMATIQEFAEEKGYYVDIIHYDQKMDFNEFISRIDMDTISGILILATEMTSADVTLYKKFNKPLVIIDNWFPGEQYNCVLMDNEDGMRQAVRYAYEMGHRRIGFVRSKTPLNNFTERFNGYLRGMREVELPVYKKNIFYTKCTSDGAYEDMTEIIKNTKELPTCLLVSNDIMAMGIMNALKYAHYNVPKDVSIISFDNMPVAKYFNPAITSVNIHDEKIGIIAVRRMLEILEDDEKDYFVHNLVGVTLEIRESVYDLSLQNNMK